MSSYLTSSRHRLTGRSALHFEGTGCPRNFLPVGSFLQQHGRTYAVVPGPADSSCSTEGAR
eukprot:1358038-Pleurochrysis_carterae.AAC.1